MATRQALIDQTSRDSGSYVAINLESARVSAVSYALAAGEPAAGMGEGSLSLLPPAGQSAGASGVPAQHWCSGQGRQPCLVCTSEGKSGFFPESGNLSMS